MTITNHIEPSVTNAKQSRYVGGREFHNDPKSVYVLAKDEIEKNRLRKVSPKLAVQFTHVINPDKIFTSLFTMTATPLDKGDFWVSIPIKYITYRKNTTFVNIKGISLR